MRLQTSLCFVFVCLSYSTSVGEPTNVETNSNIARSDSIVKLNDTKSVKDSVDQSKEPKLPPPSSEHGNSTVKTASNGNVTATQDGPGITGKALKLNSAALLRGFYVFAGLGVMVAMYILVRAIRLRRRKSPVRKYGILGSREDLEMTLLDDEDDDEEDTTLFDVKKQGTI